MPTDPTAALGKSRRYYCVCGSCPIRPLRGDPKPCDHCGHDLRGLTPRIEDDLEMAKKLISGEFFQETEGW